MNGFDFDLAVIGGGSAGFAAARTAAASGVIPVILEGGEQVGGLCILRGCMPTKALLYAADTIHLARKAEVWGITTGPVDFDFLKVMARKAQLIKEFADYRVEQLTKGPFELVRTRVSFIDPHTVRLDDGRSLRARHFIIAVGSKVSAPPLADLREVGYITSDEALSLTKLPKSLVVLGGGAVAVEFAQFFVRFGVEVTLIQRSSQILRGFDADAAETLQRVFRREGMKVYTGTRLVSASKQGDSKRVVFIHEDREVEVRAEEILFALGRSPDTADLEVEKAGVETHKGRIVCDRRMRSKVPHIYAAGDCAGPHEIVHIAIQQGEIAAHNIAFPQAPREIDYRLLTSVVFTDPQIGNVGLRETEAKDKGIPYITASYPFDDHGKSLIMDAKDGFVKLLADPQSGEILGGACVGPMGGELIHEIIAAMHNRMTVAELAAMPHYHPTLAEIWTYPADQLAEQVG